MTTLTIKIRDPKLEIPSNIEFQVFSIRNSIQLNSPWQGSLGLEHWDFGLTHAMLALWNSTLWTP